MYEYYDYWFINAMSIKKMELTFIEPPVKEVKKMEIYKPIRNVIEGIKQKFIIEVR